MRLARQLGLLAVVVWAVPAWAEPHLAAREGFVCSQCHHNRTGGGMRNSFGRVYSQVVLPAFKPAPREEAAPAVGSLFLDGQLGEHVSVGADFRLQVSTAFAAKGSFQGQQLTARPTSTFKIAEADLYLSVQLLEDRLSVYVDEVVSPESAASREAFLLVEGLPARGYLKAGRILLPYGLRLADDTAFIRDVTGFNYGNQDLGLELGAEPGPTFLAVAVSNGTQGGLDNNLSKQLTASAGLVGRLGRVGASFSYADGSTEQRKVSRRVWGAFATATVGRFTILAEADHVLDRQSPSEEPESREQWAFYGELDVLIRRGLNLRVGYDFNDPDLAVPEDQRERFNFSLDVFPLQFLRASVTYHLRRDIPQKVAGNQDLLLVQLHGFF
ncbi:MAG: hypothetical protein HYZ28_29140 [Myxococcales bacterium]|nr:hypothetical protein [Myxococcales bacterium]